jgi:2-deoxy-D-gluconate 3-dehydrogenase
VFSPSLLYQVLQVNLNAVWTLSRDCGKHMLASRGGIAGETPVPEEATKSKPRGKIINVASLVSYQGQRDIISRNTYSHYLTQEV